MSSGRSVGGAERPGRLEPSGSALCTDRPTLQRLEQSAQRQVGQKIESIVRREFGRALAQKEDELERIDERILGVQKALHLVRFGAVHDFYAASVAKPSMGTPEVVAIHPALRPMIGGKRPPTRTDSIRPSPETEPGLTQLHPEPVAASLSPVAKKPRLAPPPGYVPPRSADPVVMDPRGAHLKIKRRIIVGNVSKWIQCDQREDMATHKWMIYVRGDQTQADISDVVAKVRFLIHPSYHPHDLIETTQPPFHLTRRGWGEFPARIQIHFKHPLDKPVDIIHNLRLDKSYTGLQTLGAETNVDLWLHNPAAAVDPPVTPLRPEPDLVPTSEGWVIAHSQCRDLRDILPQPAVEETAGQIQADVLSSASKPSSKSKSKNRAAKNAQTTFIRCTGKDGKTIFLPVTFLPDNHRKKVPGVASSLVSSLPATRLPAKQLLSANRSDTSLLTKIEVEHKMPTSPSQYNGHTTGPPASPSVLLKPLAACNTPDRSSPRVSPCPSPAPNSNGIRSTNGVSLLAPSHLRRTGTSSGAIVSSSGSAGGSTVLPGTSLLKRSAALPPLPRAEPSPLSAKMPLPSRPPTLSELERTIPNVSLETWKRVLGYAPGEIQLEVESRIGKPGGPTLRKYLDWLQFLSDKAFSLKSSDFPSLESCLVYLARFLPLVTPLAKNSVYKCLHPYSSASVKEYLSWNKGRQKASEWQRAKMLYRILDNVPLLGLFSASTSTRQIIQILRWYGFHVPHNTIDSQMKQSVDLPLTLSQAPANVTCPDATPLKRHPESWHSEINVSDDLIDVIGMGDSPPDPSNLKAPANGPAQSSNGNRVIDDPMKAIDSHPPTKRACLWLPEDDVSAMTFVKDKAREVGVDLVEEEIAPRILYQATQKLMLRACKFLCESLIRKGHKAAYERLGGPPTEVGLADVLEAIQRDPLLSICSNAGLGKPLTMQSPPLAGSSSTSASTSNPTHHSLITQDIKKEPL
ncbi:hypothetical protein TCAL_12214 [Tigriopus californicus]|uniref:YEATS domain-containing protein n=1 Tax=Tigriopus californicus TaxID=6832 RepID=A0A553NRZ3_TIGCA|nr:YEATS domain-containing protein 2-like [Tigriopus californicus]TRY68206.1 hypothetical protein TCAL_12214 [Tigriopus californicus]|eukprot:TCALIF_12214-PA protein Name:"Similar to YEATS2 YEATS domain-containing protein 2 (Homo sapiens)" AED:0.00 eAED:0.00 QI:420/1/1/1/0.85/0.75/8/336/970